jgi:hypothetical protein
MGIALCPALRNVRLTALPIYNRLEGEPRFTALAQKIGLSK